MGKAETRVTTKMRKDAERKYGERLVLVKYHGSPYSEAGVSDLLGCLDGTFFAVEVKVDTDKYDVTVKQRAFLDRVVTAGGHAMVCTNSTMFLAFLETIERQNL